MKVLICACNGIFALYGIGAEAYRIADTEPVCCCRILVEVYPLFSDRIVAVYEPRLLIADIVAETLHQPTAVILFLAALVCRDLYARYIHRILRCVGLYPVCVGKNAVDTVIVRACPHNIIAEPLLACVIVIQLRIHRREKSCVQQK